MMEMMLRISSLLTMALQMGKCLAQYLNVRITGRIVFALLSKNVKIV